MRKYNGESQPTLENQGYFFEKVTFALSGNSRRVRGILAKWASRRWAKRLLRPGQSQGHARVPAALGLETWQFLLG